MAVDTPLLEVRSLTKAFGDTLACDAIDLRVAPGVIHALLGENGAGKSTLVKMLFGSLQPDSGSILRDGEPVRIASPSVAHALGIGMVFQHFSLFEALSVAENIALALEEAVPMRSIVSEAREISERYRLPVDPEALVGDLSTGQRQRVEIVRALMQDPKLLILDEPTSVLTPQEAEALFETLRTMREEGRSVLYISHRLEEVQSLCDHATVLRRGQVVDTCVPADETSASLAAMMVGSHVGEVRTHKTETGEPILEVRALSARGQTPFAVTLDDIDLTVRSGEIVCVAGVAGNGQGELFELLSGERASEDAASIAIDGRCLGQAGISARRRAGAAFVPEERIGHGSVGEMPLSQNLLLTRHASDRESYLPHFGIVRDGALARDAGRVMNHMDVRAAGRDPLAASLSGGNLQKFIVGRELDRRPRLLVVDQPAWGVDAGAATLLRQALVDLAAEGTAILVISQDLEEIFSIATHICVMNSGRLSPKTQAHLMDRGSVGLLMGAHGAAA